MKQKNQVISDRMRLGTLSTSYTVIQNGLPVIKRKRPATHNTLQQMRDTISTFNKKP